jgi:hypothetical protein
MWSLDELWLIRSMDAIILKLYAHLGVDDLLDVRSIDHIGWPMLQHVEHLSPEENAAARKRAVIKNIQ